MTCSELKVKKTKQRKALTIKMKHVFEAQAPQICTFEQHLIKRAR